MTTQIGACLIKFKHSWVTSKSMMEQRKKRNFSLHHTHPGIGFMGQNWHLELCLEDSMEPLRHQWDVLFAYYPAEETFHNGSVWASVMGLSSLPLPILTGRGSPRFQAGVSPPPSQEQPGIDPVIFCMQNTVSMTKLWPFLKVHGAHTEGLKRGRVLTHLLCRVSRR